MILSLKSHEPMATRAHGACNNGDWPANRFHAQTGWARIHRFTLRNDTGARQDAATIGDPTASPARVSGGHDYRPTGLEPSIRHDA
ncbi:MAG: hypothetical protein MZV65_21845 [Chromatiales bacterium]|nr:hypothetical protein [Chromatiales bacterium]